LNIIIHVRVTLQSTKNLKLLQIFLLLRLNISVKFEQNSLISSIVIFLLIYLIFCLFFIFI